MDYIEGLGLIATAMGGAALFPQVLMFLKTKSTKKFLMKCVCY